jgi:pantoate--beta-alanine ligase
MLQQELKNRNISIGFVPTMGALHKGHISLITQAKEQNDIVVVSIFVNPTQFLAGEDLDKYPNKIDVDTKICKKENVDILFTPDINSMYNIDEILIKAPQIRSFTLEGRKRPEHFDGVLQIVLKLFNIVNPTNAYFGKKDAQQLSLIKLMTKNLFLPINIIECEIIRDDDGLALSSRNVYLSTSQRELALNISKSLKIASSLISQNNFIAENIISSIKNILVDIDIEYIEIVNKEFNKIEKIELNNAIILIAVKIGETRLIDNLWI